MHQRNPVILEYCRLAAQITGFPHALAGMLVDDSVEYMGDDAGANAELANSFCGRLVESGLPCLALADARGDSMAAGDPLVHGPAGAWSLAGATLRMAQATGVLLVYSRRRRDIPGAVCRQLEALARSLERQVAAAPAADSYAGELLYASYIDAGTALPNATLFRGIVQNAVAGALRGREPMAVLEIGLDDWDSFKDALGREKAGAEVNRLAERFRAALPEDAVLGRAGEAAVGLLLPGTTEAVVLALAGRLHRLALPDPAGGAPATVSIGYALLPEDGGDEAELLAAAHIGWEAARQDGGNRTHRYSADLRRLREKAIHARALVLDALAGRHRIAAWFQPQVNLGTGRVVGAEALIRLLADDDRLIPPGEFLGFAEEAGLLDRLMEHVVEQALACMDWAHAAGRGDFRVGINLSNKQLHPGNALVDLLRRRLASRAYGGRHTDIEITETAAMRDSAAAGEVLTMLEGLGAMTSVDDFGTGYSSMTWLASLPIHRLKIDASFVRGLPDSAKDHKIVKAVIDLAHALDLEVLAEGVEAVAQADLLRSLGCDLAQGFLYAKPMPLARLRDWVSRPPLALAPRIC